MKHTKEHNDNIAKGISAYYQTETPENRERRINALKERKSIERKLYDLWIKNKEFRKLTQCMY